MSGRFIVLEGIDGSGKTTLARRLAELFGNTVITAEPTPGPIGKVLRSGELGPVPPAAEALLFAADRAIHTAAIQQELAAGRWVICDRYFASTVAYQSAAGAADEEWLIAMQAPAVIAPDAVLLLDLDPEQALARVDARHEAKSRFEQLGYLRRVRAEYLRLAQRFGYGVIDASQGEEAVLAAALAALKKRGIYASE